MKKRTSAQKARERLDQVLKLHWDACILVAQTALDREAVGADWAVFDKAMCRLSEAMWALNDAREAMHGLVEQDEQASQRAEL